MGHFLIKSKLDRLRKQVLTYVEDLTRIKGDLKADKFLSIEGKRDEFNKLKSAKNDKLSKELTELVKEINKLDKETVLMNEKEKKICNPSNDNEELLYYHRKANYCKKLKYMQPAKILIEYERLCN